MKILFYQINLFVPDRRSFLSHFGMFDSCQRNAVLFVVVLNVTELLIG